MSSLLSTRRNFIPRRYEPGERRIIKEGTKKFDEAKSCFQLSVNLDIFGQEAESLFHRTMSWVQGKVGLFQNKPQQNLHISELKISGNNSFFQAAKLKNQAVDMIRTRNYQMALNRYAAALSKYQEAKKKSAEGAKYRKQDFSNSFTYERKRSEDFKQLRKSNVSMILLLNVLNALESWQIKLVQSKLTTKKAKFATCMEKHCLKKVLTWRKKDTSKRHIQNS